MAMDILSCVFTSPAAQTEPILYPHTELLAQGLLWLFLSRRKCKVLGVGTSQSRSPGLFISTLLARGLAPTRNLEPADSYTVCVQTYFWISGSCILLVDAHSSPRSPRKSHTCTQNRTCSGEVSKQLRFPVTDRFQRAVSPPHLL